MRTFLIANPKGGSGKSTLATNLAGHFAAQHRSVMLGDIDRQQSSLDWLALRPADRPAIRTWEIGHDRIARPPKGASDVVIDTPAGLHGAKLQKILKIAAKVIVPVQPSTFDMLATRRFLDDLAGEKAVRKGRADIAVVGMRVDARTRSAAELENFFASLDLPVLACLRDTQIYVQAAAAGLSIFDLPPSRVERDLEQWQAILDWVDQPPGG